MKVSIEDLKILCTAVHIIILQAIWRSESEKVSLKINLVSFNSTKTVGTSLQYSILFTGWKRKRSLSYFDFRRPYWIQTLGNAQAECLSNNDMAKYFGLHKYIITHHGHVWKSGSIMRWLSSRLVNFILFSAKSFR